ncbi:MAG TPA: hypothetical protein VFK56_22350 [Mycobacterium sp.]|nr:hypothetical protein [Mycobacterium sp.]
MLSAVRRVLSFEMTIAEWLGTAAMLAVRYLAIGLLWALTPGGDVRSILWWPVMLVSTVCLA